MYAFHLSSTTASLAMEHGIVKVNFWFSLRNHWTIQIGFFDPVYRMIIIVGQIKRTNAHLDPFIGAGCSTWIPRQTSHLWLHPGRIQKARNEDLRAARLPQHLHRQDCDMSWGAVKLGIYSRCLTQQLLNKAHWITLSSVTIILGQFKRTNCTNCTKYFIRFCRT